MTVTHRPPSHLALLAALLLLACSAPGTVEAAGKGTAGKSASGLRRAGTEGVVFVAEDLGTALARAKKEGKRVFVDFDASWCPSCRKLESEVLATPAGRTLLQGLIAVHVDFDDEKNRRWVERYVILGLPTAVVLDGDGEQLVRVMGYEGKDAWTTPFRAALTAKDPLPGLRAAFAAQPGDDGTRLALGKALLVRGKQKEAEAVLEPLLFATLGRIDGEDAHAKERRDHSKERAAEALWALGRYHHRVRRDPATAQHLWRELATRFGKTSWAGGAWYWYAKAQVELGRPEAGAAAFAGLHRRQPEKAGPIEAWLEFSHKHALQAQRAGIAQAVAGLAEGQEKQALTQKLAAWKP